MQLRQKGYQPKVAERYRMVKADWLDVQINDETFAASELTREFPGLNLAKKRCGGG